jgi:hypothetical protein
MAVNFPSNPTNGQTITVSGITYAYDSTQGVWSDNPQGLTQAIDALTDVDTSTVAPTNGQVLQWNSTDSEWQPADSSAGVTVYATIDDLPLSGVAEGSMALVDSTDKLYIFSDAGWYSITLVNTTPSISGVNATYTLATDGTATVVTVTATDPEGLPLTYSIVSDTSGNIATVTQGTGANTNQWTITPSTNSANAGNFTLVFRASDGVNVASASSTFVLQFAIVNSNYTTALITTADNGYTSNKLFRDSSGNNHTITANGDATQSTFSPYRHGGYSTYFDGTGDYLTITSDSSFDFTGEFCVEFWYYGNVVQNGWFFMTDGSNQGGWGIAINSSNFKVYRNAWLATNSTTIVAGRWYHVRVNRDSNNDIRVFVDGVSGTAVNNSTTNASYSYPRIGNNADSATATVNGYISDLRVVNGSSLGTSNFTLPTERLTAITNTSLLTCHLPYIADGSTNGHSITVNGNTKTEPFGPYDYQGYSASNNGGSAYFDGTGDYLSTPVANGFEFGTGDFTIEMWFWYTGTIARYPIILGNGISGSGIYCGWAVYTAGNVLKLDRYTGSQTTVTFGSFTAAAGTWHHLAIARSGTTIRGFINGTQVGSDITNSVSYDAHNTDPLNIGYGVDGAGTHQWNGYISDIRLVKGTAVYTSDFTPPTAPLTAITNTSLLLPFDDATIIDKSQTCKNIEVFGNTTISTTQTKYGSYSMYFDGSGDYLKIQNHDFIPSRTSGNDFTIEFWIYLNNISAEQNIIETSPFSTTTGWTIYVLATNGRLDMYPNHTNMTTLSASTWYHVAIENYNGTLKCFINGTSTYSATMVTTASSSTFIIGSRSGTANYLNGYIEDLRFTNGYARYQGANFTPPTAALEG